MNGKLRALGLALLAAFAISAVVAQAAQATAKFTTVNGDYPVVVTGAQEPGNTGTTTYAVATPNIQLHCEVIEFEGTATEASTTTTITPHFTGCELTSPGLTISSSTHLNGCHLAVELLTNTSATDTDGRLKIVCPAGSKITITGGTCTVHLFPQTVGGAAGEVTFTNKPADEKTPHPYITLDIDITNKIHYEDTDGFLCPFNGNSTNTNGSLVAEMILKAYEDSGNSADPQTPGLLDYTHPATETAIHVK